MHLEMVALSLAGSNSGRSWNDSQRVASLRNVIRTRAGSLPETCASHSPRARAGLPPPRLEPSGDTRSFVGSAPDSSPSTPTCDLSTLPPSHFQTRPRVRATVRPFRPDEHSALGSFRHSPPPGDRLTWFGFPLASTDCERPSTVSTLRTISNVDRNPDASCAASGFRPDRSSIRICVDRRTGCESVPAHASWHIGLARKTVPRRHPHRTGDSRSHACPLDLPFHGPAALPDRRE